MSAGEAGAVGTTVGIMAIGTVTSNLPMKLAVAGATASRDMPVSAATAADMVAGVIDDVVKATRNNRDSPSARHRMLLRIDG